MTHLLEIINDLTDCLCTQISESGLPDVCFCGLVPGEVASQEYSGDCNDACGMAWVRISAMYPSSQVGVPGETVGNCDKGLGADLEIGIMRCMSSGQPDGGPPSPKELAEAVALQTLDALAMRAAVVCCPSLGEHDYILGPYTPLGPEGGLVGGIWSLSVGSD